jgi:hypothetical protein
MRFECHRRQFSTIGSIDCSNRKSHFDVGLNALTSFSKKRVPVDPDINVDHIVTVCST